MTLSCVKIDPKKFENLSSDWWRYLVILGFIFLVPVVCVFIFKSFLSSDVFVGLIIAAAVPSAVSVVFISDLLGGEPTKALITTTLAHLFSPIITPFLVWLFASAVIKVNFLEMLVLILKLVIIPLLLAQIIRHFKFSLKMGNYISPINSLLLFVLIWGIIAPGKELLWNNRQQFFIAVLAVAFTLLIGMLLAIWFGRDKKEDITWVIVGGYKNFTLASLIAWSMFGPMALVGAVAYGIMNNIMIAPLQFWVNLKNKK